MNMLQENMLDKMQEVTMSFADPVQLASSSQVPEPSRIPDYTANAPPNNEPPMTISNPQTQAAASSTITSTPNLAPSSGFKFHDQVFVSQTQEDRMKQSNKQRLTKYEEPEFCLVNLQSKRRIPLVHKVTVIGRNPNLLVQINDVSVSSKHASIEMNDEFTKAYLQDKGALNGCWINEQKVDANGKKRLHHNDVLRFGKSQIKYKFVDVRQEKLEKEASDSDGDQQVDRRRAFDMEAAQKSKSNIQWPQPTSQLQQDLQVQQRLARQEDQIQMLLGNVARGSLKDKEISIKQIVEDERKLLEDRYQREMDRLKAAHELEKKQLNDAEHNSKNRGDKLQRAVVDKEADLLRYQAAFTDIEKQLQEKNRQFEVSQSKLKALEQFTSELQTKHEKLIQTEQEKTQALNELLSSDLTQKVLEYKNTVTELRTVLKVREKERDIYINHLNLGHSDPQYGARLLEDQSNQIIGFQTANEELERRQGVCEKKWADLLDQNQKNEEAIVQLKAQLDQQRETYTKLLNMTEKRVIQANMQISQLYSDLQEDAKKQAAEYLAAQVYQLYDERRSLVEEKDRLSCQNAELQRLCCGQRIELDRFQAYIREDGCGPTASLIGKVEELQDLLIQQRQIADVSKIVEKDAAIRSLNVELAKKTEQLNDMRSRLQQVMAAKGGMPKNAEIGSNKEIAEHLQQILKAKEAEIGKQAEHVREVLRRENELKEKLAKLEYLYELDPNKPLMKYGANEQKLGQNLPRLGSAAGSGSARGQLSQLLDQANPFPSGGHHFERPPPPRPQTTGLYF